MQIIGCPPNRRNSRDLQSSSGIYGAFADSRNPVWDAFPSPSKDNLSYLRLFKVTQCYPVLLAAKETLSNDVFASVLRVLVVLSFRYNVICDFATSALEAVYSETARFIREQKPKGIQQIFNQLARIYPSDEVFRNSFATREIENAPLARYILAQIANSQQPSPMWVANTNEVAVNLEHVLPRRPTAEWLTPFPENVDPDEYINRIGNLTLLPRGANDDLGNISFREKCAQVYSRSDLPMTQSISQYTEWGPDQIESRQSELSRLASHVWSVQI